MPFSIELIRDGLNPLVTLKLNISCLVENWNSVFFKRIKMGVGGFSRGIFPSTGGIPPSIPEVGVAYSPPRNPHPPKPQPGLTPPCGFWNGWTAS